MATTASCSERAIRRIALNLRFFGNLLHYQTI